MAKVTDENDVHDVDIHSWTLYGDKSRVIKCVFGRDRATGCGLCRRERKVLLSDDSGKTLKDLKINQ